MSDQPEPKHTRTPDDSVLVEAERIINGQRRADYGGPLESFTRIANYWTAYLQSRPANGPITPENVAMMMVMMKIARAEQGYHRDSLVDVAGYAGCVELMQREREAQRQDFGDDR